ncbi:MAG: hypothetical protein ACK5NI_00205 [bacterium]
MVFKGAINFKTNSKIAETIWGEPLIKYPLLKIRMHKVIKTKCFGNKIMGILIVVQQLIQDSRIKEIFSK